MYEIWLLKLGVLEIIPVFNISMSPIHHSHHGAILILQVMLCSLYVHVILLWDESGVPRKKKKKKLTMAKFYFILLFFIFTM